MLVTADARHEDVAFGGHICAASPDEATLGMMLEEFVQTGVARNEQVLVLLAADDPKRRFQSLVPHESPAALWPRVVVDTAGAMYAEGGVLDADETIRGFRSLIDAALADGRSGLRCFAEVDGLLADHEVSPAVLDYERRIQDVFLDQPVIGVCHVLTSAAPADALAQFERVHPYTLAPGATFALARAFRGPDAVRVVGEIDLSNAELLREALADAADRFPTPVLDLAGVDFLDARSIWTLIDAADNLHRSVTLRAVPTQARRLLEVSGLEQHPSLRLS